MNDVVRHVTTALPSRSVKVAILSGTNLGGAERCFISLVKYMRAVQVHCWVNPWPSSSSILDAEIRRLCPYHIATNDKPASTAETMRKVAGGANVILSWGVQDLLTSTKGLGLPVIDVSQNSAEWDQVVKMKAQAAKGANYFAAVSEGSRDSFPEEYRAGCRIIPNGIEVDRVAPREGREATRAAWGIEPEQKVVLYLARFDGDKNPQALLNAMKKLPDNWVLVAGGSSSPQKTEFCEKARNWLEHRFRELRVTSFVGDAFAAADVYCLPSNSEGLPLTLMECFVSRTPAAVCRWAVVDELERKHGKLCEVVPVKPDPEVLAGAITRADVANDPNKEKAAIAAEFVNNAYETAWNNYTAGNMAAQYEKFIIECVADWGRRALATDIV